MFDRILKIFSAVVLLAVAGFASRLHPPIPYTTEFDYLHRPTGYHWEAQHAPVTGDIVYYGVNPINHETVYVGPDGTYYHFPHPPPIAPGDDTWVPQPAM